MPFKKTGAPATITEKPKTFEELDELSKGSTPKEASEVPSDPKAKRAPTQTLPRRPFLGDWQSEPRDCVL
jgi:hypothetical protein